MSEHICTDAGGWFFGATRLLCNNDTSMWAYRKAGATPMRAIIKWLLAGYLYLLIKGCFHKIPFD